LSVIAERKEKTILLSVAAGTWSLYAPQEGDLWLARDVLDKQVVDTTRAKVVRVNAILLAESPPGWQVEGVEIGGRGLLLRLGLGWLADWLSWPQHLLPWSEVSLSRGPGGRRLEELHPTEIAAIVHELPPAEGSDLVETLTDEAAADALEEIHPDRQADLVEEMAPERAADILEEMAPDEAADILQDLPEEKAQELLRLMDQEEATEVAELLAYPEDSAGGIMTPEYAVLPPHFTVPEALAELRRRFAGKLDDVHYVYVTDEAECLLGVLSLWDLIVADPQSRLADFMETNVVSVRTDQKAEEAARLIARYNLLALPVVNEEGRLVGIVAVDDAMDLILPEAWRQQLPRMY
jgi:CBS domain-containing protein